MNGFYSLAEAAKRIACPQSEVNALIKAGVLLPDRDRLPQMVSRASVDAYLASLSFGLGQFAVAVAGAQITGDLGPLQRIYAGLGVSFATEGVGTDGGFAVPTVFENRIVKTAYSGANLLPRCASLLTPRNTTAFPLDHKPPHDETTGIVAYWVGEGQAIPQSKPNLGEYTNKLGKLAVTTPVSAELLEDASALGRYLDVASAESIAWKASFGVLWGTGVGMSGFMGSPSLRVIAAEVGQASDTIVGANVAKMFAVMPAASLPTAVWICHPDALGQLIGLTINAQIIYTPGDAEAPAGRLLGCPIIPHEACTQLGDLGDISFVDLNQYLIVTKDPAIIAVQSMHLFFDRDLMAFKFTMRICGAPLWSSPVQSRVGGTMRSPFCSLASR